jgi:hypothetical protein
VRSEDESRAGAKSRRFSREIQAVRRSRLGLYSVLWLAACTGEPLSVGQPPCEAGEEHCETPEQVFLNPQLAMQEEVSGESRVEWQRLLTPPGCMPKNCVIERSRFVLHETGEITLAALLTQFEPEATVGRTRLWVAWLDADGQSLWEDDALSPFPQRRYELPSDCSPVVPCVGSRTPWVRSFELRVTSDGRVIALVGSGRDPLEGGPLGRLAGYAIERAGRVTPEIMLDSLDGPPGFSALVQDDVIIADDWSAPPAFIRYSARGELLWRQSDAVAPPPDEFGIFSPDVTATSVLQIATDSLGRVWALLDEDGILGFLRLEPTGRPAWRAWAWGSAIGYPAAPGLLLRGGFEWIFDGQQRPLIAISSLGLLRLEPEVEGPVLETPSLSFPMQEEFYSPSDVFGLDTDAEDRVYLATHEGPRSARRLRIDRISSDFLTRERYILDVGDIDSREGLSGLQVTPGGDVYVLIAKAARANDVMGALASTGFEAERIQLARLQLSAPVATTAAGAR